LMQTRRRAWNQARTGGIDEGMDGQHSYPHIHNVLVSPPLVTTTIAYLPSDSVLTMGSTSSKNTIGKSLY
ncbi:unnamed protein product, partial [marine sediment metagenome]